jgi:mono/diheme cytochrome c family protein
VKINILITLIAATIIVNSCGNNDANKAQVTTATEHLSEEQLVKNGEHLFKQNCKMCHGINASEDNGMAPILDSVKTHWPDKNNLAKYIKNAKENLNTNDYTTALYEKWKAKPQMPPYLGLNEQEVQELVTYLHYVSN